MINHNIDNIIDNRPYWAHTDDDKQPELLKEHLQKCLDYYDLLCKEKGIGKIIKDCIKDCNCTEIDMVYMLFVNAIYMHDIGKINPNYQRDVLKNMNFKSSYDGNSRHSLVSSLIYIDQMYPIIMNNKILSYFLFSFAYCISRHHGYLDSPHKFIESLADLQDIEYYSHDMEHWADTIIDTQFGYDRLKRMLNIKEIPFYILNKLLYSLIVSCDFCATFDYKNGDQIDIVTIDNIDVLQDRYKQGDIYRNIERYKKDSMIFKEHPINKLRTEMFLESEECLIKNLNGNIFYLEAPTGGGKTNISINLGLKLIEKHKELNNIFYIFPFNTLVEQTADELFKYFPDETVVINSITPIIVKETEDERTTFEGALLNRQLYNYPVVITSHVNLFHALFGCNKEQVLPLAKMCNSVIIIDEIQSYKNSIWREIIMFLDQYSKLLNIKFIIMSATLPKLDRLLGEEKGIFIDLIEDIDKYYQHPLFKDRVESDFSLIEKFGEIELTSLAVEVLKHKDKKVLVEFITKARAKEFCDILKSSGCEFEELTGDDNKKRRNEVIRKIKKEEKPMIIVATQVIEAGVDIDMEIGFKEVSIIDSEEQFIGRINRSSKRGKAKVYFFMGTNPEKIYRNDARTNYTIVNSPVAREALREKRFAELYSLVMKDIYKRTEKENKENILFLLKYCLTLDCRSIQNKLSLMEPNIQIFLPYTTEDGLDGRKVWMEYEKLCTNGKITYAERKVYLSRLSEKMSYFTFNIINMNNIVIECDKKIGQYYFFEDGGQFIIDGKFARNKFTGRLKGLFL